MTPRDSILWLPKELYSSVEQFADPRFIWCPMPFDDSLPIDETSFIHMGKHAEENFIGHGAAEVIPKDYDRSRDSAIGLSMDFDVPPSPQNMEGPDEPDEAADPLSSETDSDKELPVRRISQNIEQVKRRQRKTPPLRHGNPKLEDTGGQRLRENRGFAVHLGLNLDVEVTLKASVYGGLELSMLGSAIANARGVTSNGRDDVDE